MGLYTEEEVRGNDFKEGLASWPVGITPALFWRQHRLGPEEYSHTTKQTAMTNPLYRILLRAVAESISNRGNCPNNATGQDLFYLFCIIERRPCNLAKCLALYLYERGHGKEKGAICGGSFVCHLALKMGVVTQAQLDNGPRPDAQVGEIGLAALRNMGIADNRERLAGRYRGDSDDESDEESDDDDEGAGAGEEQQRGAPARGRGYGHDYGQQLPDFSDLANRFSSLEVGIQRLRDTNDDYYLQMLHQQRYQSESQYEFFSHHQMPMHPPPHMFMPPEPHYFSSPPRASGSHQPIFPQRDDVPPPPSYYGGYPQFGTYQGGGGGGEPSIFPDPNAMDD